MSVILEEGSKLPKVKVETEDGVQKLSDVLDGDLNVLFFYPKDNTSGCTKEACSFTEHSAKFKKLGVKIFGISPDSQKSHEKFIEKYSLKFPFLLTASTRSRRLLVCGRRKVCTERSTWVLFALPSSLMVKGRF